MTYSVVIPTNRSPVDYMPTLQSLENQTMRAQKIFLIIDKVITQTQLDQIKEEVSQHCAKDFCQTIEYVTNINHAYIPHRGVSYVRNFGISLVKSLYTLCVDDDNTFEHNFVEDLVHISDVYQEKYNQPCLLIPTEWYKGKIRSRGYRGFSYRQGKQLPYKHDESLLLPLANHTLGPICFASSNCLFAATQVFRDTPFDEDMSFVYEDFDCTARMCARKKPLYVVETLNIQHHMQSKTSLQETYIHTGFHAFQKAKNRLIFVAHTATVRQKIIYILIGLPIHTIFLYTKILLYAPRKQKIELIQAVHNGTIQGLQFLRRSM